MTASRFIKFGASVVGSWFAGVAGALLVWNFLYGIGSRVVTDEIYEQLLGWVETCGSIAGAGMALSVALLLRRPAPEVLVAGHMFATVAGFCGATVGWVEALWAYFGGVVVFVVGVALRVLFSLRSHGECARDTA
jgi:hypothetical protein